jgi:glycosyltransferase involved in cell wall biosynthesis
MTLRMLFCPKDRFPPLRVDVAVLFGRELASRGFLIDWVMQSQEAVGQDFKTGYAGGTAYVGRTNNGATLRARLHKHILNILHDLELLRLARTSRYDIVQVRDKVVSALIAMRAARGGNAAFVYWLSFPFPESSLYLAKIGAARYPLLYRIRGWVLFRLLYKYILPRADHIFVQSEQMKSDLAAYGIDRERMTSVPMGVDLRDFDAFTPASSRSGVTVAYLGTLAAERRIDFLVRSIALVCKDVPGTRLLLVGGGADPQDEEDIKAEARRLGIEDNLEITGMLPRAAALARITEASVCVSPFYPTPILNSTSPTKLIEYMAMGLPVVANDHPEQKRVLQESSAGICVPYTEEDFAGAILSIVRDPEGARQMGHRGRRYVAEHRDYQRIAATVAAQYERIVAASRAGRS